MHFLSHSMIYSIEMPVDSAETTRFNRVNSEKEIGRRESTFAKMYIGRCAVTCKHTSRYKLWNNYFSISCS